MRTTLKALALSATLLLVACGNSTDEPTPTQPPSPPGSPASPTAAATPTATPEPRVFDAGLLLGQVDADRMLDHAHVLSVDIGPRVAGTPEEFATVEYIAAEFESLGYEVSIEPFEFEGDRFAPGAVSVGETTFEAFSLVGSAAGEVSGPLVFAGLGSPGELDGLDVEGAIVVSDRGEISFGEKYEAALARGAVGLVVVNNEEGPLVRANLAVDAAFPVVGGSLSDRDGLLLAAESGLEATMVARDGTGSSWNVMARAAGTERCLVLAGGHHDTAPASPGGNDNASGVAHVLELARVMALDEPVPGLCFATFGAEESGLHGSRAMAAEMAESGMLPDYMLNFDVTGLNPPVQAIGTDELVERALAVGSDAGVDIIRSSLPPNVGSDHISFAERDVPVVFFETGLYPEIHTPEDTFDLLERDGLEAVAIAGLALMLDLYSGVPLIHGWAVEAAKRGVV